MNAGRPLPLVVAVPQVVVAGVLTRLAFPDPGWWPCALLGVAAWLVALAGRSRKAAAALGLLYGLSFFGPLLQWSGVYVGALPWFALATLQALYIALVAALLPTVLPRRDWSVARALAGSAAAAGLWTAQEALRDRTPFGGFPWGRLAFSQADSPFASLAAIGGVPLVSFAAFWCAAAIAWGALALLHGRRRAWLSGAAVVAIGCLCIGFAVPLPTAGTALRVAGVQGDVPEPGLDFNAERRAVLDNHARATLALASRVADGSTPAPDVVIWPENASDLDPFREADARQVINAAVDAIGVPTLVGAVLQRSDGRLTNASIVWTPQRGPGEQYAKRHPVPFGEYIPYRDFFRHFSSKVDLVRRDFVGGDRPGVLQLGPARVGVVICFEVAYDDLVRDTVRGGADLLVVQTNNATFGYTDEAVQQLAMSRLRAIEHGRAVAHISTVGVSALISPDGQVLARSKLFTPAVLEAALPLRTSLTVADRVGVWPEALLSLLGLLGCALLGAPTLRAGRALTGRRRRLGSAAGVDSGSPSQQVVEPTEAR